MTIRYLYVPDRTDILYWKLSHTAYRTLYIHCCHSGFADTVRYQKLSTRRHCSGTDGICHHCHSQLYRYFHNGHTSVLRLSFFRNVHPAHNLDTGGDCRKETVVVDHFFIESTHRQYGNAHELLSPTLRYEYRWLSVVPPARSGNVPTVRSGHH